ncbi:MAG: SdrD B-like domain-containing protein [Saprospiraceae bacterium]
MNCKDSEVVTSPQPCSNAGGGNKIGDYVWNDINGNGLQEANEPGLSGVWIILEDCNGNFKNVTFTDINGMYMFSDITPGDYKIRFANPGGFVFTAQNAAPDAADSDVDVYGYTDCFTVTANTINNDIDAGFTTFQPQNCVITGTTANVVCDDNGTPNDPSDDTFTFEVSATAVNDGAWGWAIPALNLTYLPYGQPVVVGPYPISGGNVTLTLRDQDKQDCLTTVTAIAPQPCSTTPVCDNVTNGGQIGNPQTNCGGFDPAPLTSVSLPTGGSGAIEYMWLRSTTGCPTSTNQAIPGANAATYDPGFLSQTTWFVRCSRRANCTDWTVGESNCVKITIENCPPVCDNVTNGGQIGGAQTNCGGFDPAPITSVSLPTGGSGAIEYMWLSSTTGCPTSTNQAIAGAHAATYDPGYLSQTTWFVRCSRRANCTDWTVGESNCVKIEVKTNCGTLSFNCNNNITATAAVGESGTVVTYNAPTASSTCPTGSVSVVRTAGPASGSVFPIGTTTVTYVASDNCGNSETCSFNVVVTPGTPSGDCTDFPSYSCNGVNQGGWEPWWEWIANVKFAGIDNPSSKDQYRFFADVAPASIAGGQAYNITLTPGLSWGGYQTNLYWRVWIDFNRDGDFDDAGELVVETANSNQVVNATVQVPANAATGGTRMRIAVQRDQYAGACENFAFGEMEDYKVCITGGNPCADADNDGVCDSDDCAPNNPNIPATPGTPCNDGNPTTFNDVIGADGCTCAGTPDVCTISAAVNEVVCSDNGTPANPSDDTYTFKVTVFRTGGCNSATWNGGGQSGPYNTAVTYGPYAISSGGRTFVITNAEGATSTVTVDAPNTCSSQDPCSITTVVNNVNCDDNGTPTDPSDDTYTFKLKVSKAGYCTSSTWNGGGQSGNYGVYVTYGPYPISGGGKTFVVSNGDGATTTVTVQAPNTCSNQVPCSLNGQVTDILCDDNGTPTNADDDTYTFKLTVTKTGYCTSSNWNAGGVSGNYGTATTFGPYPISGGNKVITVTNADGASKTFTATAPAPCSEGPEVCVEREVTNNKLCGNNLLYGLWIDASFSGYGTLDKHYEVVSGTLTEYADGTARFVGTFANKNNGNVKWDADIHFSGRTENKPSGSPHTSNCYNGNGEGFWYYTNTSGTLTGRGALAGAKANVSRRGPAFQLGVGANLNEADKLGGSGWLTLSLTSQPNNGSISNLGDADFNWNLSGQHYACVPIVNVCVEREVTSNKRCADNILYGLWISANFSGHGTVDNHYKVESGTLKEYEDGTATFTGTFVNRSNANVKWVASIDLTGRTSTAPAGSPKTSNCYNGNGDGFWYYQTISGTLLGQGAIAGAKANVSRRGPAFQLGVGANLNEGDKFGASGWLTLDLISQPNSGSISNMGDADFNWNLSGQQYACVAPPVVCNRTVLFVVGSTWLGSGDLAVKNRLIDLGFDVTLKDDSDCNYGDGAGYGLVLISSTCSSSRVGDKFRDIDVPVVSYEGWIFDDMKMTGGTSSDYGKWGTSKQIKIISAGHPLAAGFEGTIDVCTISQSYHWGKPSNDAIKVAAFTHDNNKLPFFAYEKGKSMVGKNAPARRVGLFFDNYSGPYMNNKGWALFDACILWASECQPLGGSSRIGVTQFDATLDQGIVSLAWVNNTGYKNDKFTVERSLDGVNFEPLLETPTMDDTDNARFYKELDKFPVAGFNYYRLVNHYVDGSFEVSEIRKVRIDDIEQFGLFPNPAADVVNVALKGYEGKDITIQLVDQLGRLVKEETIDNASDTRYEINISNARNGVYTLWIFADESKPVGKKLIIANTY